MNSRSIISHDVNTVLNKSGTFSAVMLQLQADITTYGFTHGVELLKPIVSGSQMEISKDLQGNVPCTTQNIK